MSEQFNNNEQFIQVPDWTKKNQETGRAVLSAVASATIETPDFVPKAEVSAPSRDSIELDPSKVNPDNVFGFDENNPDHVANLLKTNEVEQL